MAYTLIDGKATATAIKQQIAEEVKDIVARGGKQPHLAAVLVGHDGGSETYVKNKVIACEQCGFKSSLIRYEADVTEEELLACVDRLNKDEDVDGFIVQMPLPKHIDEQKNYHGYRLSQRCRWIPSHQCGTHEHWLAVLHLGYATWHPDLAPTLSCGDLWQEMRHPWPQQYRRKAYGATHDAEAVWRRYSDRVPLSL